MNQNGSNYQWSTYTNNSTANFYVNFNDHSADFYAKPNPIVQTVFRTRAYESDCQKCATCGGWCPIKRAVEHMDDHVGELKTRAAMREYHERLQAEARLKASPKPPAGEESSFLASPAGIKFDDVGSPEDMTQFDFEAMLRRKMYERAFARSAAAAGNHQHPPFIPTNITP